MKQRAHHELAKPSLAGLKSDHRGAALVEFGFIVIPLIAIVLAIVQVSITLFTQQTLETATEKSARLVMTGQNRAGNTTQAQFKTVVCGKLPSFVKCSDVMVDIAAFPTMAAADTSTPTITYNNGVPSNSWSYDPGDDGEVVRLRIMYLASSAAGPLNFTVANQPNGKRLMIATLIFKNETTST
ncbi:TadE/TadG family type IV pilus assembly protein [Sphingobium olei]|uniref:TadE/TadG family type IV pilus assembly protein n=1 Tax=Sphingobium olei TaxID=420955 RepID=A0ABW3P4B5_9SPHN|nr:pilus assembly protein [Sphingobium sp.]